MFRIKNNGGMFKMMKKIFSLMVVFLIGVLMSATAFAAISIDFVKVDGDTLDATSSNKIYDFERGEDLDVKVRVTAPEDHDDVQIEVVLRGIDSKDRAEDITDTFDMKVNVTYTKKLSLSLVERMDQDTYKLRVRVSDRDSPTVEQTYELEVDTKKHDVEIRDRPTCYQQQSSASTQRLSPGNPGQSQRRQE